MTAAQATWQEIVIAERERLGRKFTGDDLAGGLNSLLGPYVADFLANYTGNFAYLVEMKTKRALWPNQLAGVINCMYAEAKRSQAANADTELAGVTLDLRDDVTPVLKDGYYTVVGKNDANVTLRLRTSKSPKVPKGTQVVSYLFGPANTSDYKRFGYVFGDRFKVWQNEERTGPILGPDTRPVRGIEWLLRHPDLGSRANKQYALMSVRCYRCNAPLTDVESIERGCGPICAGL